METPQTFPTQAAKDAALLKLADWLVENADMCNTILHDQWHERCDEYTRLKSIPVIPVESVKSAEEILGSKPSYEIDLTGDSVKIKISQFDAINAMHQYAAQSVQVPSEDAKKIIDETTAAHPYRQRGKPETYSDYNQGWEDACDILGNRIMELLTK